MIIQVDFNPTSIFINFFTPIFLSISAQNKSDNNPNKSGTRTLGNQVIRKGNLCIQNLGIMKGKSSISQHQRWLSN